MVSTLALVANNAFVYIGALFIIATLFTEGDYLLNLIAIMRGDKEWFGLQKFKLRVDSIDAPWHFIDVPQSGGKESMEYKILNTLWTKQVNYGSDFSKLWGFTVGTVAPEYRDFVDAANHLKEQRLIFENEQGMRFLTAQGIVFCAENYKTFPKQEDQYWPDEKIEEGKLQVAIQKAKELRGAKEIA